MNDDRSHLWWNEITGPSAIVQSIAEALLRAQSVMLCVPDDLPWRRRMRDAVENALRKENDNLQVSYVDCQTDCDSFILPNGDIDVPTFLIKRYGLSDSYNTYRHSSNTTIQDHIIGNNILQDRVVWVKGMNRRQVKCWVDFCIKYNPCVVGRGLFVIESYEHVSLPIIPNVIRVDYTASYYDALLFNNMIISFANMSVDWKKYIAMLSAQLCGEDVELSVAFMNSENLSIMDPVRLIKSISGTEEFQRRYEAKNLRDSHPFTLLRQEQYSVLQKKVWEAQLRTIYPLVEMERVAFIRANENEVLHAICSEFVDYYGNKRHVRQFGEILKNPYDAEIGTLYGMNHMRRAEDPYRYVLYIPDEENRKRLTLLHEIRNAIAHMTTCTVEQVAAFLNQYPYKW